MSRSVGFVGACVFAACFIGTCVNAQSRHLRRLETDPCTVNCSNANTTSAPTAAPEPPDPGFHFTSFVMGLGAMFGIFAAVYGTKLYYKMSIAKIGADRVWKVDYTEIKKTKLIGKGKFGKVYKAIWREKTVAVKILNESKNIKKDVLIEFVREVQIMSDLRHPNVLLFMGACVEPPNLAIVTAFMVKGSLWDLVHMAKPDEYFNEWNNRVNMLINIALGMNYLHGFNPMIIHRDLKTPNVLVDENYTVCVSDFGLTHIKDAIADPGVIGNPLWNAPELYKSEAKPDEKIDVYSFGIILWEVITMEIPFLGVPLAGLPMQVAVAGVRPDVPKDLPQHMSDLIQSCWQGVSSKRPTFQTVLRQLRTCRIDKDSVALGLQASNDDYLPRVFSVKHSRGDAKTLVEDLPDGVSYRDVTNMNESGEMITKKEIHVDWDVNVAEDVMFGRKLGEGMSAEVFYGKYRGKETAVKKIFFSNPEDDAIIDFYKETKLMKKLIHQNVVRLLGCSVARPFAYILTEFMECGSMYDMYKHSTNYKGQHTPSFVSRFSMAPGMTRGALFLHQNGVVHRDMKSPNVMVRGDDSEMGMKSKEPLFICKVGDFGLSRVQDSTQTMTICGSPLWTAPEMLMSKRYDEKVDVYSLGVILWELHQWDEPYPGMMVYEIVKAVVQKKERPAIKKDMDKELVQIMEDSWKHEPADRPTMAEMLSRVEKYFKSIHTASMKGPSADDQLRHKNSKAKIFTGF